MKLLHAVLLGGMTGFLWGRVSVEMGLPLWWGLIGACTSWYLIVRISLV